MTEHYYRNWRIRLFPADGWQVELLCPELSFQATLSALDESHALDLALKFIDAKTPSQLDQAMMICSRPAIGF